MSVRAARPVARRARPRSAVRRVTEVLDAFAKASSDLGISELARQLRCSKSVVHRLLAGLAESGYVAADPITRRYRLGSKALLLAQSASARDDLRRRAMPHLEVIRERTGETATLSLLRGTARVYVEQLESLDVALGSRREQASTWSQQSPAFVNNVTAHIGLTFFLPFDFEYHLPR